MQSQGSLGAATVVEWDNRRIDGDVQGKLILARQLRMDGQRDEAVAALLRLAAEGDIEAMIELAHWELDEGNRAGSDLSIDKAEQSLREDDWDGHVTLSGAYSLPSAAAIERRNWCERYII